MKLTVQKASKKSDSRTETFEVEDSMTVEEVKDLIAKKFKISPNSQGLKFAPSSGADDKSFVRLNNLLATVKDLRAEGLNEKSVLELKNLGTQVPYRLLFLSEYLGPMPIMLWFATRPAIVYGAEAAGTPLDWVTQVAVWAYVLHFVKRQLETFFVHKFSKPSVPLDRIFVNNAYYSGFAALVAYFVCHPDATPVQEQTMKLCIGGMAVMELGNLLVHLWFAAQRKGDKDVARPIPAGPLFFVSCPNYFFEIAAWCLWSVCVGNHLSAWAFTAAGAYQMGMWALEKHGKYKEQDKANGTSIATSRSAMIPFIL